MSISLMVKECDPVDVGRNVVRIDSKSMKMIGVTEGDLVEVAGNRGSTYARCLPVTSKDVGKGIVLLDRILETNASVQTGDFVTVGKVGSYDAQKVILVPFEDVSSSIIDNQHVANFLKSFALKVSDHVVIPFFGSALTFRILDVQPKPDESKGLAIAVCTEKTQFIVADYVEQVHFKIIDRLTAYMTEEERLLDLKLDKERLSRANQTFSAIDFVLELGYLKARDSATFHVDLTGNGKNQGIKVNTSERSHAMEIVLSRYNQAAAILVKSANGNIMDSTKPKMTEVQRHELNIEEVDKMLKELKEAIIVEWKKVKIHDIIDGVVI